MWARAIVYPCIIRGGAWAGSWEVTIQYKYSKHYRGYYDHVENLDHACEADAIERERSYTRPEGLIEVTKGKRMLREQRMRAASRKTRASESRDKEGLSICPQCEKPYVPGSEERCSRCGTRLGNAQESASSKT